MDFFANASKMIMSIEIYADLPDSVAKTATTPVESMGNSIQLIVMWTRQECISENFTADVPSTGAYKLE